MEDNNYKKFFKLNSPAGYRNIDELYQAFKERFLIEEFDNLYKKIKEKERKDSERLWII